MDLGVSVRLLGVARTTIQGPINRNTVVKIGCRSAGRILNPKWSSIIPMSQTTTFVSNLVDGLRSTAEFSLLL